MTVADDLATLGRLLAQSVSAEQFGPELARVEAEIARLTLELRTAEDAMLVDLRARQAAEAGAVYSQSGAAPDPLDRARRLLSMHFAHDPRWDSVAEKEAREVLDALLEVARAARAAENALRVTAPKASQPWLRKLVPLKTLRAALVRLDKQAQP